MVKEGTYHARIRRHERLRKELAGTADRPRLAVFRSLTHIYAQIIDDRQGTTLAAASTLEPGLKGEVGSKKKIVQAETIGKTIAVRAKEAGVSKVVFDRGGYRYHGRIKALAEAARAGGLEF